MVLPACSRTSRVLSMLSVSTTKTASGWTRDPRIAAKVRGNQRAPSWVTITTSTRCVDVSPLGRSDDSAKNTSTNSVASVMTALAYGAESGINSGIRNDVRPGD